MDGWSGSDGRGVSHKGYRRTVPVTGEIRYVDSRSQQGLRNSGRRMDIRTCGQNRVDMGQRANRSLTPGRVWTCWVV